MSSTQIPIVDLKIRWGGTPDLKGTAEDIRAANEDTRFLGGFEQTRRIRSVVGE
ncbi:hypothetical protein [Nocardiopsis sp. YSL2]|uniref:hypothetical protein n=1 Tax=Nocardiopsis sp. YSL2 TaxID=2939492 RepID=UPI0026F467B9|nr:hypothetical protein [Nocardiopsis sp. YSL2]